MKIYKISIEDINVPDNRIEFYLSGEQSVDNLLLHETFTGKITDAKMGETFTIKGKVFEALKINPYYADEIKVTGQ